MLDKEYKIPDIFKDDIFEKFKKHISINDILHEQQEKEEQRHNESLPPKYVIYTVHGTRMPFSKKPEWIKGNKSFCKSLNKGLGWRAMIVPFEWSGKNSVSARWKAAQELRQRVKEYITKFPDAHHMVIAHSHGGNVTFMAIDSEELAKQVLGVATLATPFLSAQVRPNKNLIDPLTGLFSALFAGWAVMFFSLYRGLGYSLWPWALTAVAGMVGIMFLGDWLIQCMLYHAKSICDKMPNIGTNLDPEAREIALSPEHK